eukprot:687624-Pelagomonas_calceolata.AAC.1
MPTTSQVRGTHMLSPHIIDGNKFTALLGSWVQIKTRLVIAPNKLSHVLNSHNLKDLINTLIKSQCSSPNKPPESRCINNTMYEEMTKTEHTPSGWDWSNRPLSTHPSVWTRTITENPSNLRLIARTYPKRRQPPNMITKLVALRLTRRNNLIMPDAPAKRDDPNAMQTMLNPLDRYAQRKHLLKNTAKSEV